ncbi:MAG: Transposase IS4 family protein [uncultured bacterium]|nr:MAG: Transposase IS4 family protein [uncultured bacterium]
MGRMHALNCKMRCSVDFFGGETLYNGAMFLRRCCRTKGKKDHVYWELVESYRTERGPRQRVVAYLGDMDQAERHSIRQAAIGQEGSWQSRLFDEEDEPEWVEVNAKRVRVERVRDFGGCWLGLVVAEKLGLLSLLDKLMPQEREEIPWSMMAMTLVLMRLCEPSSELRIAEHLFERSALGDFLGIPDHKVNDDRLYRALDHLLPHKVEMEKHLKGRLGELFDLDYDLLLYDVTSTYFEGESDANEQAQRGYSRDHRPDCKQVCIALVVSRDGLPLGYELFNGNRSDATTVEDIVEKIESQYGASGRIWVMDRGMISEENLGYLRAGGRRYIVGTPKSQLKRFERELLAEDWQEVRGGLEVKLCSGPDEIEVFILCRSSDRKEKEKSIHERFEKRIEKGLEKLVESCSKKKQKVGLVERRVGKLLGANTRAAGLFKVEVSDGEAGKVVVKWEKVEEWRQWAELSEGCYLLRSNVADWDAEQLWRAYTQLTEAEEAFRIQKGDLWLRPIWHQKMERVQAHVLVCFLAYVLWKMIGQLCKRAGLGDEPRKAFDELAQIKVVDVVLRTRQGTVIRKRCIAQPSNAQAILLQKLQLHLPQQMKIHEM